jgi:hypothetical protein
VKIRSALKRQLFHLADQDRDALVFIREELQLSSDALAVRIGIRELNRRLREKRTHDMTRKPLINKGIKRCSQCGTELGTILEIEQDGVMVQVLQAGNQYIMDERAMCAVCLQPVYWNVKLNHLEKLASMHPD